jgi:catechol 2,3-dioxygenase-like lactoylglutathione lyase family enzyme
MITGVNHITLSVTDIDESFAFYSELLGFKPIARWPKGAYLLAGDMWIALVVDKQARRSIRPEYTHIAFTVASNNFQTLGDRIRSSGAKIWQENKSEGESLYFADPNGHKLEIHASDLGNRIRTAKQNPWEGLKFFV